MALEERSLWADWGARGRGGVSGEPRGMPRPEAWGAPAAGGAPAERRGLKTTAETQGPRRWRRGAGATFGGATMAAGAEGRT
jgi:hypothetical protein